MKKYILIVFTLIVAFAAKAQVNDIPLIGNKFTFGIDGGLAIPSSDYGSTSASSSSSNANGFAKMGFCYDAYAGFKFSKIIGIMVQYGASMNSFNTSDLSSNTTESGNYTVSEYLIGPYMSVTLVKIKIEAKLMGGLVSSNYPTISSSSSFGGITSSVVSSFSNGNSFGYCAGAKIKYMMIGGMLGIGLGLDYVGSDVSFKGVTNTETTGMPSSSTSTNPKMSIGILQATLGLSLDI
jgi:hypothetical protein